MVIILSIPSISRNAGTYNIPAQSLGVSANAIQIAITRASLPLGNVADISMELSADNGNTWVFIGGINLGGGVVLDRSGQVALESVYTFQTPLIPTDQVRAKVILHQNATAGVEVRTLP
jgi:hypothetical protein